MGSWVHGLRVGLPIWFPETHTLAMEKIYRTLTDTLFSETFTKFSHSQHGPKYHTTSDWLGPGDGYENVMKRDQHEVQDAKGP